MTDSHRDHCPFFDGGACNCMRLEQRHRDAVLALITVRNYLSGEYRIGERSATMAERVLLAMKAIEQCLAAERR